MIRLGIFGGSFDPLHIAHKALAEKLFEFDQVDRLLIVPTYKNPLKEKHKFLSDDLRLQTLRAEFEDFSHVEVSTLEIENPELSYTAKTLDKISELFPEAELRLIVGSDHLKTFSRWKKYEKILMLAQLLVIRRKGYPVQPENFLTEENFTLLDFDLPEISSDQIQQKISRGEDISAWIPSKTHKIIKVCL